MYERPDDYYYPPRRTFTPLRVTLFGIILFTLPFYCVGFFLWGTANRTGLLSPLGTATWTPIGLELTATVTGLPTQTGIPRTATRHPADGDAAQSITTDAAAVHPDSAPTVHRHAVCLHSNLDAGTYTDLPADLHSTARRDPDAAANHDSLTYFGAADQHATADFGTADACATPNRSAPTFTNAGALADGSTAANSGTVIDIAT